MTCISYLKWVDVKEISHEAEKAEAWAKGWPERERKNIKKSEFNKNFSWYKAWQKDHKYVFLKNLVPFLFFIFLFIIFFRGKNTLIKFEREKRFAILLFSLIGTIYFLIKFPLYRYGYSYLIVLISVLSLQFLDKFNSRRFLKIISTFIIICLVGIFLKQGQRLYKYHEERNLIPNDRLLHTKYQGKLKK